MKNKVFSSKAQNIINLKIKNIKIPKSFVCTVKKFEKDKDKILEIINKKFHKKIIIRSSNKFEDSKKYSLAGNFLSIGNINPKNTIETHNSILKVIKSYKKYQNDENELLIQDYITGIKMSGVATSCDLKEYSPYTTINYSLEDNTSDIPLVIKIIKPL